MTKREGRNCNNLRHVSSDLCQFIKIELSLIRIDLTKHWITFFNMRSFRASIIVSDFLILHLKPDLHVDCSTFIQHLCCGPRIFIPFSLQSSTTSRCSYIWPYFKNKRPMKCFPIRNCVKAPRVSRSRFDGYVG